MSQSQLRRDLFFCLTDLCLFIRLETQQAAHLVGLRVDDSGANHIVRVGVDTVQQLHSESHQLVAGAGQIERLLSLEDSLRSLLLTICGGWKDQV